MDTIPDKIPDCPKKSKIADLEFMASVIATTLDECATSRDDSNDLAILKEVKAKLGKLNKKLKREIEKREFWK